MSNIKSIEKELKYLEKLLLKPSVRKSIPALSEILSDDYIEFGSSGNAYTKKVIIKTLQEETVQKIYLSKFKIKELGKNYFLVTYRAAKEENGEKFYSLRSSIWRKKKKKFEMIFHQGTKVE